MAILSCGEYDHGSNKSRRSDYNGGGGGANDGAGECCVGDWVYIYIYIYTSLLGILRFKGCEVNLQLIYQFFIYLGCIYWLHGNESYGTIFLY